MDLLDMKCEDFNCVDCPFNSESGCNIICLNVNEEENFRNCAERIINSVKLVLNKYEKTSGDEYCKRWAEEQKKMRIREIIDEANKNDFVFLYTESGFNVHEVVKVEELDGKYYLIGKPCSGRDVHLDFDKYSHSGETLSWSFESRDYLNRFWKREE